MARTKAAETTTETVADITPEVGNAVTEIQQTGSAIVDAAMSEQQKAAAVVHQRIGRRQMMSVMSKLVTVTDLVDLQNLKESKAYKNYTTLDGTGNSVTITTWKEYCEIIESRSVESVDLDLKNLNALGPELFESMRNVGIGPSTMRLMRQLPDDDKQLIQQAVNTSDKDELAEFVEQIITKNARDKAELSKKLEEATATIEAKDSVAKTNVERINELQEKVARIKKMPVEESSVEVRNEVSKLQSEIEEQIRVNLHGAFAALCEHEEQLGHNYSHEFITAQANMLHVALLGLCGEFGIQLTSNSAVEWEKENV